jgi:hypothetical protein
MSTFALDSNNDLYFSNKRLAIVSGSNTDEEIAQRLRMRLKFFIDLNIVESILREQILNVEGVREIVESSIDYDENEREVQYSVNIVSINNTVITENLVVL